MPDGYTPDYGGYERQISNVHDRYNRDSIQNAYGRFLSQQRGQRNLGDMRRSFQRQTPQRQASFGQRGLMGSGVSSGLQRSAMQNWYTDYGRDVGRTQQDLTRELQQYDLSQMNLDDWKQSQLAGIESQRAREIADAAANLQYLQQLVGGLQ